MPAARLQHINVCSIPLQVCCRCATVTPIVLQVCCRNLLRNLCSMRAACVQHVRCTRLAGMISVRYNRCKGVHMCCGHATSILQAYLYVLHGYYDELQEYYKRCMCVYMRGGHACDMLHVCCRHVHMCCMDIIASCKSITNAACVCTSAVDMLHVCCRHVHLSCMDINVSCTNITYMKQAYYGKLHK